MANGRQLSSKNFDAFLVWIADKSDSDYRALATRGVLSRKDIAQECGFAKSVLAQNPRIKTALKDLEAALREKGILPQLAVYSTEQTEPLRVREGGNRRTALDAERLMRLERENASLKAENRELKKLLSKHAMLSDALTLSGRLPR